MARRGPEDGHGVGSDFSALRSWRRNVQARLDAIPNLIPEPKGGAKVERSVAELLSPTTKMAQDIADHRRQRRWIVSW
jgi:hypothetical protein